MDDLKVEYRMLCWIHSTHPNEHYAIWVCLWKRILQILKRNRFIIGSEIYCGMHLGKERTTII